MLEIKNGTLDDFFDAAIKDARDIDNNKNITESKEIWMDKNDLFNILKPARAKVLQYLKGKDSVDYSVMLSDLKKSPASLNQDLELLEKYELVDIFKENNSGHGVKKVIKPHYPSETIEFRASL